MNRRLVFAERLEVVGPGAIDVDVKLVLTAPTLRVDRQSNDVPRHRPPSALLHESSSLPGILPIVGRIRCTRLCLAVYFGSEELIGCVVTGLGSLQSGFCIAEKRVSFFPVCRRHSDADPRFHRNDGSVDLVRRPQAVGNAGRKPGCRRGLLFADLDDDEPVSLLARDDCLIADASAQTSRNGLQESISNGLAVEVIDLLELAEFYPKDGDRSWCLASQSHSKLLTKIGAVGEASQGIPLR